MLQANATTAPAVPVASVEVKVPQRKPKESVPEASEEEDVSEDDNAADRETGSDTSKAAKEEEVWVIAKDEAQKAIYEGMAQIVQQIQFIFHNWKDLNVVWAVGACGRWAQFFRFDRRYTPAVDYAMLSNDDGNRTRYYPGPHPYRIPEKAGTFLAFKEDGSFTEEFKESWRLVIDDAKKEFIRMEGLLLN